MRRRSQKSILVSNRYKVFEYLETLFTLAYDFLSQCEQKSDLSFRPTKRSSLHDHERTAKISQWDPKEAVTKTLLDSKFDEWSQTPSRFFSQPFHSLNYNTNNTQNIIVIIWLQATENIAHSRIIRRIYSVVLHRQRACRHKNDDAGTIALSISQLLHREHDLPVLTSSVESMIRAGSSDNNIAEAVGMGSLFVLGTDIPDSTYVSHHV
jgi:hypothetical protein